MVRIATFNANGIRAAARRGFFEWFRRQEIDILCVQESKAHIQSLDNPEIFIDGYECFHFDAHKKGYSGVMIYTRIKPEKVHYGMGFPLCDTEGRFIAMEWNDILLASVYFPSGTSGEVRQEQKYIFLDAFYERINAWKKNQPNIIICGDVNIAHKPIDLDNWKANQKCSGFLPEEREWMDHFLESGWQDGFRICEPRAEQYSWWSYRARGRERNVGWRIDYHLVTHAIAPYVKRAWIEPNPVFSDHAPVMIDYAF